MLRAASITEWRVGGKRSPPEEKSSSLISLVHFCWNPCFGRSLCRMADADKHGLWGAQGGWRRLRTRPESKEKKKSRQGCRRYRQRRGRWIEASARLEFGGIEETKEECCNARGYDSGAEIRVRSYS